MRKHPPIAQCKPHIKLVHIAGTVPGYMVWAVYRSRWSKRPFSMCRVFATACAKAAKFAPKELP